jgi:DNA-binding PadR family transcriptional regulator
MLKLTSRQQAFLDNLFELYREFKGPVHYSVVAEKLGVNKFSAYDMLKILEEKGVAASSYVLNDDQTGPGRSQIVFYPTNKAAQFLTQLREEVRNSGDWQKVKQRMLRQLEEARQNNPVDALRAALSNLAEAKPSFNYCAEMISVLLLNIERLRDHKLLPALDSLNISGQVGLGALAGLSLASALTNEAEDTSLTEKLLAQTQRFQTQLAEMSDDSIKRLSAFLTDARIALNPPKQATANND